MNVRILLICCACVLVLLVPFGVAYGDVACPPTDTPEPTAPGVTPMGEPTPTSPPGDIATPTPQPSATVTLGVTPDPTATETDIPGRNPKPTPTPNMVMPQTGGGLPPNVQIGLTVICGIALLFVAGVARRARA